MKHLYPYFLWVVMDSFELSSVLDLCHMLRLFLAHRRQLSYDIPLRREGRKRCKANELSSLKKYRCCSWVKQEPCNSIFLDLSSDTADRYLRASCALTYYASVNLYIIFTISLLCSLIVIFVLCALLILLLYNRKGEHIATTLCSIIWERSLAKQSYSNASISAESGK